jgi:hypothetical protein
MTQEWHIEPEPASRPKGDTEHDAPVLLMNSRREKKCVTGATKVPDRGLKMESEEGMW